MTTALRFTRAAFGAVQRASPGLAARWAERLFCSPPRRPISERMAAWLAGGRRFDLTVGRRRVAAWSWGERGTGVLLVHGWGSRGARFVDLGGALLASRSEEHTSELQSRLHLVCRLLLEKKKKK